MLVLWKGIFHLSSENVLVAPKIYIVIDIISSHTKTFSKRSNRKSYRGKPEMQSGYAMVEGIVIVHDNLR